MPAIKLRVLPAHTAMVPDYEAAEAGLRRYIGRRFDPENGDAGGFAPVDEPVEIPMRDEYLQEIAAGCLIPADEVTARLAKVPFKAPPVVRATVNAPAGV